MLRNKMTEPKIKEMEKKTLVEAKFFFQVKNTVQNKMQINIIQ